jgi:NADP-dependent 3-hydroxy acid dehydrogenase YdfG
VVLAARNLNKLKVVQDNCIKLGAEVLLVQCDVSIENDCKALIEKRIPKKKCFICVII